MIKLEFVNNNEAIDKATRSRIRRHAATGLNVGRKINRPSRSKVPKAQPVPCIGVEQQRQSAESSHDGLERRLPMQRVIGDSVSVLDVPVRIAPEERWLVHNAVAFIGDSRFTPGLAAAFKRSTSEAGSLYSRLLFQDQACYHCALAMVLEYTQIIPQAGTMAIRHLNQTFRLINDRISSTGHLSVSTLAVVMALSTYESSRGFYDKGMIHASGVFQMVEMRGLAWLATEAPQLFAKLFRADLDFALRLGTPTKLDITALEQSQLMKNFDFDTLNGEEVESNSVILANLDSELLRLWNGFSTLAVCVNEASRSDDAKLSVLWFALAHLWLGHRLLDYAPLLGSRPMGHVESMVHLGLATMVNSFVCGIDRRVAENDILVSLIKEHAHLYEHQSGGLDDGTLKLLLWLLYIGSAVVIQHSRHDAWLVSKTRETMWALGVSAWDDVRRILSSHPWIHDLYDQRAYALYDRTAHIDGIQALSLISPP